MEHIVKRGKTEPCLLLPHCFRKWHVAEESDSVCMWDNTDQLKKKKQILRFDRFNSCRKDIMNIYYPQYNNTSRSTRKPALWTLRNVSSRIRVRNPRRLIRVDTFRLHNVRFLVIRLTFLQKEKNENN